MLRIDLLLRFSLLVMLGLLLGCTSQKNQQNLAAKQKAVPVIPLVKNCPLDLTNLRRHQSVGYFLSCEPAKDGTPFEEQLDSAAMNDPDSIWLLVDTANQRLEVKQGNQTVAVFADIAVGRAGAGQKKHRGDDITPKGDYKIGWINSASPFYIFYGLTYPSVQDANQAYSQGMISESEYGAIVFAHQYNQIPPQNTALGGQVGLHGLGRGDEEIHRQMNWTHGCVALTNEQIDELNGWIYQGMRVKIK
jgi:murein L,D-transpeptidase YafK